MRNIKALFSLAVVGAMIYLAIKLIPPYAHNYQFAEEIASIARLSSYVRDKSGDDIKQEVLAKARELEIQIGPDDVKVEKTFTSCSIDVQYVVHVDLPVHPVDLKFNPTAGNKIITAQ